jgi:cytochrome c peroxidase
MTLTVRSFNATGVAMIFVVMLGLLFTGRGVVGAPGDTITSPLNPTEIPVEIEVETGIGSLKQAPLWKELVQMLEEPDLAPINGSALAPSAVQRRPGFGVAMPPLNVWPLGYNFLTAQPLRIRTSDAEISWDQPGFLFDPDEVVAVSADPYDPNVPVELRTPIGALVSCVLDDDGEVTAREVVFRPGGPCEGAVAGALVVSNPNQRSTRNLLGYGSVCTGPGPNNGCSNPDIPPHRTVVALPAVVDGVLYEGEIVGGELELEPVAELEMPVNEEHFYKDRLAAEVLGKALFWDMQVGSDGVQSCGTCHFHAGADNRTRNQLNPNTLGGDLDLEIVASATTNVEISASDFPFHKRIDPDTGGDGLDPAIVVSDANDVFSSMGISRFTQFDDVIVGAGAFEADADGDGVAALLPDLGTPMDDPVPIMQGVRRIEPRNTPTFHAAAFNLDNFWDARARFHFNGGSVHGQSDPFFHVFLDCGGELLEMAAPLEAEGPLCDWTEAGGNYVGVDEGEDPVPVRIKFSSLGSQAVGPPLSDFEMAFAGRNWQKIGKKLLQPDVVPLANQRVAVTDSRLGPWSNQGGSNCDPADTAPGKPGLCISYPELIRMAFEDELWSSAGMHLAGTAVAMDNACDPGEQIEMDVTPTCDPFDGYVIEVDAGAADPLDTDQFTQMEANFSLFFALSAQAYESLTIPDDTPFDRFMDINPLAANGIGQPGEQGVLFPTLIPGLVGGGLTLIPDDPSTSEYDGFGAEELFGFDIFAGGNLTAALPVGSTRNPQGFGSNPFTRTARCMLCHLGPEQTDHSINISHGLIKGDAEFEFPSPQSVLDPGAPDNCAFEDCLLPAPEPPGRIAAVGGLVLAEEVEETPQDAVEVEPLNFAALDILADDPSTFWLDESTFDDRIIGQPSGFAFGDQGIYNVGLRPSFEDIGRGGDDAFGWPLSLAALTMKNLGGEDFEPCDDPADFAAHPTGCRMTNFDPELGAAGGMFEETGGGLTFPGTAHTQQSINPGYEREPIDPQLPEYLAEWVNGVPAGELHPSIDEMAGWAPNTITTPNGGPAIEFGENMFGSDPHCGVYDPAAYGAGGPHYGWGPVCPNNQSGVPGNILVDNIGSDLDVYTPGSLVAPLHGTWPFPNRARRDGQFKAPQLRNVELTGPYFHTGSFLTLRQVVDFYMRGGNFPLTNAESRDQHMVDVDRQAFGFGTTRIASNGGPIPDIPFADAMPDTAYQYDPMPDMDHPVTPEPATSSPEAAKVALVKYLLALTDPRVKYEKAPFDRPEIFVPIDGAAPENTGGRSQLVTLSGVPCPVPGPNPGPVCFRQIPEVGAAGNPTPTPGFLGVTNNQAADCVTEISHFCR